MNPRKRDREDRHGRVFLRRVPLLQKGRRLAGWQAMLRPDAGGALRGAAKGECVLG